MATHLPNRMSAGGTDHFGLYAALVKNDTSVDLGTSHWALSQSVLWKPQSRKDVSWIDYAPLTEEDYAILERNFMHLLVTMTKDEWERYQIEKKRMSYLNSLNL